MELYTEPCVTILDGKSISVPAGTILSVCPGSMRHSILPIRNFYIKLGAGWEELTDFMRTMPLLSPCPQPEQFRSAIRTILSGRAENDDFRVKAGFYTLFSALKKAQSTEIPSKADGAEAIRFLKENYTQDCSLQRLASHVHLSPIYFHNLFKQATGKTSLAYLAELRLEQAKLLLTTGSLPISQIAELSGFSSDVYLSAVFKKHIGCTPRQFRNNAMQTYRKP